MSRENVEIVRRMWEASWGNDPVSALSFYDPGVEWDGTWQLSDDTERRAMGIDELVQFAKSALVG